MTSPFSRLLRLILAAGTLAVPIAGLAIVNGVPATDKIFMQRFSWAVALEDPISGAVCTAQRISPSWVLTAAHCAWSGQRVLIGNSSRRRATAVTVAGTVRHPRFDPDSGNYDVGLIRLAAPVPGEPLRLASRSETDALLTRDAKAVIAGWGRRSTRGDYSDRLIVSDVELGFLGRQQSFFAYMDTVSGPCGGDSGGPLLRDRGDGVQVLLGVAIRTGGDLCTAWGGVGIYVDVSKVRDFIESHVKDLPR